MMIKEQLTLKKKTCVVFGANGLIGKSVTQDLAAKGAEVIAVDLSFDDDFPSDVQKIIKDLSDEVQLKRLFLQLNKKSSLSKNREWVFVNCSYPRTKNWSSLEFENISSMDFKKNIELQIVSMFLISQMSVIFLKKLKGGVIINFSSIYGSLGPDHRIYLGTKMKNNAIYAISKSGVKGLTRFIATSYAQYNIRANTISPGGVYNNQNSKFVKAYSKRTPLGRMATPQDISNTVSFLVSDAAQYITGQDLKVDGGWSAW